MNLNHTNGINKKKTGHKYTVKSLANLLAYHSLPLEEQLEGVAYLQLLTSSTSSCNAEVNLPIFFCYAGAQTVLPCDQKLTVSELKSFTRVTGTGATDSTTSSDTQTESYGSSASANIISSSLFYDPFTAARTTLTKKSDAVKLAIWCCHLECVVDVYVSNPLSVPMVFTCILPVFIPVVLEDANTAVESIASDVQYELCGYPVTLPAYAVDYKVSLPVKPLTRGVMVLSGIKFVMNKTERIIRLNKTGVFRFVGHFFLHVLVIQFISFVSLYCPYILLFCS